MGEHYTIKELAEAKGTSAPVRFALLEMEARLMQYADRIEALEAENERLREALEPFTFREDGDDEAVSIQHPSIIVRCEVTYGDIQLARAALEARHD